MQDQIFAISIKEDKIFGNVFLPFLYIKTMKNISKKANLSYLLILKTQIFLFQIG